MKKINIKRTAASVLAATFLISGLGLTASAGPGGPGRPGRSRPRKMTAKHAVSFIYRIA